MEGATKEYGAIGWAMNHLRHGHQMRRRGWNGRIEFVAYVPKGATQIPQKFAEGHDTGPFLIAKRRYGGVVPWTPTQNDLLQDDWELVNQTQPGEYHLGDTQTA